MALNDIVFTKENGGMGRTSASEDPISGLILGLNNKSVPVPDGFDVIPGANIEVARLRFFEQLKNEYGITETPVPESGTLTDVQYAANAIVYHVREFFRMSPAGTLFLALRLSGEVAGSDIKALQRYSEGSIRQVGVLTQTLSALAGYQTSASELEAEHQPLSIVVTFQKGALTLASFIGQSTHISTGRCNVSLLIGCDLDSSVVGLLGTDAFACCGCIGNALGALSAASVHESIAWVQKFPTGLNIPGFITGELVKETGNADLTLINDNRFLFVRVHTGIAGSYYNDSFTLDIPTSDYANIENVRTIDKAVRGIRRNLLPGLGSPVYTDAATGKLRADTVAFLETAAGRALEDMEKAGELSGYIVEIDPEQNIMAASSLEVQIKNVAAGVMRRVNIKIGYVTKID